MFSSIVIGLRHLRSPVSWAAAGTILLSACDPAASPPGDVASGFEVVESPAGPGAEEPNLSSWEDGVVLSWLEPAGEEWALRFSALGPDGWSPTRTVVTRPDLFVNWADFPSVVRLADGRFAAHWLQRGAAGGYDYGVRVSWSDLEGESWSAPWTPHTDGTPTEHGFVSLTPAADGSLGVLWLDGRRYADRPDGAATDEMTLRHRVVTPRVMPESGETPPQAGPETLVDARVCDCCQTDMAPTSSGWIAVYRDRTGDELRDIYVTRLVDGEWTEGRPVHRDGWTIAACPVNGPAVAASGDRVAVAWFTEGGDVPRVQLAFSDDGGERFAEPVRIDDGSPVGRVDVLIEPDGGALVTWIERADGGAQVRMRRVAPDGRPDAPVVVAATSQARSSGFPRVARLPDGGILAAWTDVSGEASRVAVARRPPEGS